MRSSGGAVYECRNNNALLDAKTLTKTLMNSSSIEQAFDTYYQERYSDLTNHLEQGRLLKTIFLEPENTAKEAISCLGN
jgi:hypothetical protein